MSVQPRQDALALPSIKNLKFYLNNLDDGPHDGGGGPFGVMPSGNDPIEKFPAFAHLHDQMHGLLVLERLPQLHHVRVIRQCPHYLHLPLNVGDVDLGPQPSFGNGLAGEVLAGLRVHASACEAELAAAELFAEAIALEEVGPGGGGGGGGEEDGEDGGEFGGGGV